MQPERNPGHAMAGQEEGVMTMEHKRLWRAYNRIAALEQQADRDARQATAAYEAATEARNALVKVAEEKNAAHQRIAELEAVNENLRKALELYEAVCADEMKYSPSFQRAHDVAQAALAAKELLQ